MTLLVIINSMLLNTSNCHVIIGMKCSNILQSTYSYILIITYMKLPGIIEIIIHKFLTLNYIAFLPTLPTHPTTTTASLALQFTKVTNKCIYACLCVYHNFIMLTLKIWDDAIVLLQCHAMMHYTFNLLCILITMHEPIHICK